MDTADTSFLTITPLGGLGEIGLNCQLWETRAGVVMIDCGLMFPSEELHGVDVLIPDFSAVLEVKERLCAIVLTHGHEDHIGALPWLVPHVKGIKILGSRFTLALVQQKLCEHGVEEYASLEVCAPNQVVAVAGLSIHFFPVMHSIPEAFALGIESPVGRILHSGDFKIEKEPLSALGTDLNQMEAFAKGNLRLLLSDSTNSTRAGFSTSEREVQSALAQVFAQAHGRIIVTLFASNIQRIQEVFDLARNFGRTVVISGRSLASNIEIAVSLGLVRLPPHFYNAYLEVPDLAPENLVFIVTGAQGEPLSALSRMVFGGHKQLAIGTGDTVVMSSRIIPGNTRTIIRLINEMYRLGAEVLYESSAGIHASGHAYREELRMLLERLKPQLFVPIHGEYEHLVKHSRLALECGLSADQVVLLEDGQPMTLTEKDVTLGERRTVERTAVDGKGIGDVGTSLLRERRILGADGIVVVLLIFEQETGSILRGPEILSKGFVFEMYDYILEDAKCLVLDEVEKANGRNHEQLNETIRMVLRRFFRRVVGRDPCVMPIITSVSV